MQWVQSYLEVEEKYQKKLLEKVKFFEENLKAAEQSVIKQLYEKHFGDDQREAPKDWDFEAMKKIFEEKEEAKKELEKRME